MDRINNNYDISSDPALWGKVNPHLIHYYASYTPSQNLDADFDKSERVFGNVILQSGTLNAIISTERWQMEKR